MLSAITKARTWADRARTSSHDVSVPRVFQPPYGGASYYGQAYKWEQSLHYKFWTYAAISASMREVAGSESPNIGRVSRRDPDEEAKVLKAVSVEIRRKSLGFSEKFLSTNLGRRVLANRLVEKGLRPASVNRVLRLNPPRIRKALGGPKQHQDFEPYDDDHPLVRLFKRPNSHYVAYDLWAYHMLFKGLHGQVHWWVMRNEWSVPVEIWVIPTHWMRMETDGNGKPVSYAVQSPWGQLQHVPFDQVVSFYDQSPLNIYEGHATTLAINEWIDSYEAQVRARLAGFKNMGAPALHIALGESYSDPDEAFLARMYAKWYSRFLGEDNYNRPLITGPDIEVKNIGAAMSEVPFTQGEEQGRDMTLAAYGVPKGVLGIEPTTDVSAYAPQRQYVRFKINPELKYIGEVVTEKVVKPTPGHDDGVFFFDDHVIDNPEDQLREIQAKWEKGAISPNEIRVMFGDEPWEYGGNDPVLNGTPVNWCTGKDPEPDLTGALEAQMGGHPDADDIAARSPSGYSIKPLGSGRLVIVDSGGHVVDGPFPTQEDAEIALSKREGQEAEGDGEEALGRQQDDGSGALRNDGFNVSGIDPDADEESLIGKGGDSGSTSGNALRWHRTHDNNLEARGRRKWRIERVLGKDGNLVSYRLHLDGQPHDESSALGILKEVAEALEKGEAAQSAPEAVVKEGLASGSGSLGGYTVPQNGRHKGVTVDTSKKLQEVGRKLASRSSPPKAMPGYGQIYAKENEVWYVGGDGDDKGFDKVVREAILGAYPTAKIRYEAEAFPPKEDGWIQVYPKKEKKAPNKPGTPDGRFTVAVDLHGTLAQHGKGDGPSPIGEPMPGAKEAMEEFKRLGFRTTINSVYGNVDEIRAWLDKHGIPCDYVNESPWGNDTDTSGKIDADVYVDDRGMHFKGDWEETADKVKERAREVLKSVYRKHLACPNDVWPPSARSWKIPQMAEWMVRKWVRMEQIFGKHKALEAALSMVVNAPLPEEDREELMGVAQGVKGTNDLGKAYEDLHAAGPDESMWSNGRDREFQNGGV